MIDIVDFTNCKISSRNLSYGGRAGEKRGIIYKNENWILKFPKNTKSMNKVNISYTTSPLSEYIGSKIYKILGYDVHETILGIYRNGKSNKVVCACKDFIKDDKNESLYPYTALRNDTSKKVMENDIDFSYVSACNINEILFQLENNEALCKVRGVKERFWDVVLIDILINNNDRNEDNWGLIKFKKENTYKLSPIYDNGNCFYNKIDDEKINLILSDKNRLLSSSLNCITAYEDNNEKRMSAIDVLSLDDNNLKESIKRVSKKVKKHLKDIKNIIFDIPECYEGVTLISKIKKEYYFKSFELRFFHFLSKVNE